MRLDYKWQVAIIGTLGLFMAVLDNTIVSVALPQMQLAFQTDFSTITWVATGYFLAQAAVIPIAGYLSDKIGTKLVFMLSLGLFTLGSGLCAIAPTETLLILFRVIQGVGGGGLFPIVFALIYRAFPPTERGIASAIIGVPVLLAPAFGPTVGGYLTTTFSWNAIFIINLPLGVIALVLAYFILRGRAAERQQDEVPVSKGRFDFIGLALSMIGFTAVVYGISEASSRGWGDGIVLTFLIGGGVVLVAFVITELLVSDPVMDVRLFLNYTFSIANVLSWALAAFLFGSLFLLPFFFERVQGLTPLTAGEILILQGLGSAAGVVVSGSLYNRVGPRIMAVVGFALVTVGTIGLTQLTVATTGLSLQSWLVLRGFGIGLVNIPLQTLALSVVSNKAMARASSLVNVTRQVFSAVGVSVLTTYLTQRTIAHGTQVAAAFQQHPLTGIAASCAPLTRAGAAAVTTCVTQHITTQGLNDTFTVVAIACGICTVVALFVGRDPAIQAARRAAPAGETVEERQPTLAAD
jgi:EmrB/QacA subfamily drug resistance transporter